MQVTINLPTEIIDALANAIAKQVIAAKSPNPEPSMQKWLTHKEAAAYLKKTPAALYALSSARALKFTKRGKQNYYRVEDLDIYMDGGMIKTTTEIVQQVQLTPRKKYSLTKTQ